MIALEGKLNSQGQDVELSDVSKNDGQKCLLDSKLDWTWIVSLHVCNNEIKLCVFIVHYC